MSMSLNRVQLIGNLTRDPEVRQIPGGQVVATFGVATNFRWKDQSGQLQNKAEFHNIVAWRKLADICGQYLRKGGKVFVEGRIQTRDWEGEDGVKRYRTEIIAENMIMLDRKGDTSSDSPIVEREPAGISNESSKEKPAKVAKKDADPVPTEGEDVDIDDLPF